MLQERQKQNVQHIRCEIVKIYLNRDVVALICEFPCCKEDLDYNIRASGLITM